MLGHLTWPAHDTLLLANFAFALSLLSHHIPSAGPNLIATSFDSLETCKAKYTDAEENINQVCCVPHVHCKAHDVSAPRLGRNCAL